jgi:hypothetical protein
MKENNLETTLDDGRVVTINIDPEDGELMIEVVGKSRTNTTYCRLGSDDFYESY